MQKKLETTTPGPWQVHANPTKALGYMLTRAALGTGGGIHIGNVYSEDNARLIAAAPQMKDVLREMILTMDAQVRVGIRWDPQTVADARAAYAAATGDE